MRVARFALACVLALLFAVTVAAPAEAACAFGMCSRVYNSAGSRSNILVASKWQATTYNSSTKRTIRPGQSSSAYLRDVGAFWISTGCRGSSRYGTFYGGRWYRPNAGFAYSITVRC